MKKQKSKSKEQSTQGLHKAGAIEPVNQSKNTTSVVTELSKPVKILETIDLDQKFILEISPEVQEQIRFLCSEIHEVEWSGILFYDSTGEFGNSDFKCIAKYILPMNKGTKSYTEFDTGTEAMEFLMENNEFLDCKQGLIHSHNTFNVFFSGTDQSEIASNAVFHNYYLSLIVNNKNEMCAKIASVGKMEEKKERSFEYTGENGIKRQGTSTSTLNKEVVFLYTCDIQKPNLLETRFTDKVKGIIAKEVEESRTKFKSFQSKTPYLDSIYNEKGSGMGWYDKTDTQQMNIFDTEREDTLIIPSSHSNLIEGFVSTLIAQDPLNTDSIEANLKAVKKKFGVCRNSKNEVDVKLYINMILENYDELYDQYFEDPSKESYEDTLEEVVEIFEDHSIGNWVADNIFSSMIQVLENKMITHG